jgi:hypothetical protein
MLLKSAGTDKVFRQILQCSAVREKGDRRKQRDMTDTVYDKATYRGAHALTNE